MKLKPLTLALIAGAAVFSGTVGAQDSPAAPMMTDQNYFERERAEEEAERQQKRQLQEDLQKAPIQVSRDEFRTAYSAAGSPKLVFLFGENFSGLVSDWHSQRRLNVNARVTGNEGTDIPDTQNLTVKAEDRVSVYPYRSALLSDQQWFEYERGFRSTLFQYGIKMINRDVAIRLLDSEIREQTQLNPQDDNQRLEMDMLRKHSELLVEVIPYRERRRYHEAIGYNLAMTLLGDATMIADDRVAIPEPVKNEEEFFTVGPNGYEKVKGERQETKVQIGPDGYEIVREEKEPENEDIWAEQGRFAAQASLQLMYERWLSQ